MNKLLLSLIFSTMALSSETIIFKDKIHKIIESDVMTSILFKSKAAKYKLKNDSKLINIFLKANKTNSLLEINVDPLSLEIKDVKIIKE